MSYITDGVHLYEIAGRHANHGLRGGEVLVVCDCASGAVRVLSDLEAALCRTVGADADGDLPDPRSGDRLVERAPRLRVRVPGTDVIADRLVALQPRGFGTCQSPLIAGLGAA